MQPKRLVAQDRSHVKTFCVSDEDSSVQTCPEMFPLDQKLKPCKESAHIRLPLRKTVSSIFCLIVRPLRRASTVLTCPEMFPLDQKLKPCRESAHVRSSLRTAFSSIFCSIVQPLWRASTAMDDADLAYALACICGEMEVYVAGPGRPCGQGAGPDEPGFPSATAEGSEVLQGNFFASTLVAPKADLAEAAGKASEHRPACLWCSGSVPASMRLRPWLSAVEQPLCTECKS
uniref:Uncharacterized protein n=1 Tax=Alexandrium monilatum TaxID=311494 RepID=A0A7S4V4I2_9DINO